MKFSKPIILLILSATIVFLSLNVGMFWDNVLFGSKVGKDLFQNGIFNWHAIALNHDAGHPPFTGVLLAAGWTLLGKSLVSSHIIMFPFIFGFLWQLFDFVSFFVKEKFLKIGAFILVVLDPTLLSQLVLVGPEIIQLFFFFLALNGLLQNNISLKIIGLAFLGIVTYRGMMLCAGIFIIDVAAHIFIKRDHYKRFFSKKIILTYLLAATPASFYVIWRLVTKGWLISHPLELWGNSTEFSSIQEFLTNFGRNILVLGYQFIDFGRIVLLLFIITTLYFKRKNIVWKKYKWLILISIFSTIIIYTVSLLLKNTMGHRYYITSYIALALLSFLLINEYKIKKTLFTGLLTSLLLGNYIVYSDSFAQGWDSSLAHLPYWNLRKTAINYMDAKKIPVVGTASFFPNSTSIDNIVLNGDLRYFKGFSGEEMYVFYSNVYNLNDADLKTLRDYYHIHKSFTKQNVRIEIMKKNE